MHHTSLGVLRYLFWGITALGLLSATKTAVADPISPGYDVLYTPGPLDGGDSYVYLDLNGDGTPETKVDLEGNPLTLGGDYSSDDFFPGVDPATLQPAPFDELATWAKHRAELGVLGSNADTIVQRKEGLPSGEGTIDIELVALSLRSVDPVDLGGTLFDLEVAGGSLLGSDSGIGEMIIRHEHANGGTFDATLPVSALLTFTAVGDPTNTLVVPWEDTFTSTNVLWSHDVVPEPSVWIALVGMTGTMLLVRRRVRRK